MPIHDWTRVDAGIFHAFHHDWITEIAGAFNSGLLPAEYYALAKPIAEGFDPDDSFDDDASRYAAKADAVAIHHVSNHRVVALVEIISPGNKNNQSGLNSFVRKAHEVLAAGLHLLLVDLFPPGPRDPLGIHGAVWGEDCGPDYAVSADKPLACVAYIGGAAAEAFIEPLAVGDVLPDMPLFLTPDEYVAVPLNATYEATLDGLPTFWRDVITTPAGTNGAAS